MKLRKCQVVFTVIFAFGIYPELLAQPANFENVKSEIMEVTNKEINALKSGDCQTLVDLLSDEVTFYLNGRKAPSKEMILGFCKNVPRPFEKPSKISTTYFPLSENSAYVIRTMEFSKEGKVYKREIVTKVWVRIEDKWKMAHLHSTIKDL